MNEFMQAASITVFKGNAMALVNDFLDKNFIKRPRLRRFITRLLEGDKETEVYLLGSKIRINSTKEHGYLRAHRASRSSSLLRDEIPIMITLANLLEDGDTFLDIGANVGIYSVTLSKLAAINDINFYAFEANEDTFSRLAANCAGRKICPMNLAISERNEVLEFVSGAVSHVFTRTKYQNSYSIQGELSTVNARRLDSLDLLGDSLILKIDVEGQELEVLLGAEKLFLENRIRAVYLDGCDDMEAVIDFLSSKNFSFLDGRTLGEANESTFSLLAIKKLRSNG